MFIGIMLAYALVHIGLFVESFFWADNSRWRIWFLRLLLLGMAYDNLLQALGAFFAGEDWFVWVNYPRYYLHVWVLPFLCWYALSIMNDARIGFSRNAWFVSFCMLFTIAALIFGAVNELLGLELELNETFGVLRLTKVGSGVPYATVLTNIVVLLMAAMIWNVCRWNLMFWGTLFILVVNGASAGQKWGFLASNFAEIIFILA
jgi:hypothetical protein